MFRLIFSTLAISGATLILALSHGQSQTSTDGKSIFRFDTFGDEQLWTDTLRMQQVIRNVSRPSQRCGYQRPCHHYRSRHASPLVGPLAMGQSRLLPSAMGLRLWRSLALGQPWMAALVSCRS